MERDGWWEGEIEEEEKGRRRREGRKKRARLRKCWRLSWPPSREALTTAHQLTLAGCWEKDL